MTTVTRKLPTAWAHNIRPLSIVMIGAGGNGSELTSGLTRLHQGLTALGGAGLHITLIDDDEVEESNVVRQLFWPHEVGCNKAVALIHRTNMLMGTNWDAIPTRYTGKKLDCDLIITAVDNLEARRNVIKNNDGAFWLDLGCDKDQGQVILGRIGDNSLSDEYPCTVAHFPAMLEEQQEPVNVPSCSAADSLARQDLMINQTVAGAATNLLWKAFRGNEIPYNGVMIDLASAFMQSIPFMPAASDTKAA